MFSATFFVLRLVGATQPRVLGCSLQVQVDLSKIADERVDDDERAQGQVVIPIPVVPLSPRPGESPFRTLQQTAGSRSAHRTLPPRVHEGSLYHERFEPRSSWDQAAELMRAHSRSPSPSPRRSASPRRGPAGTPRSGADLAHGSPEALYSLISQPFSAGARGWALTLGWNRKVVGPAAFAKGPAGSCGHRSA